MQYSHLVARDDCNSFAIKLTLDNYYQYTPNLGAAIFFAIVFAVITMGNLIQSIRYRTGYMWVLAMGTSCTVLRYRAYLGALIGFCARAAGHFKPTLFPLYLVQQIFTVSSLACLLTPGLGTYILSCDQLCRFRAAHTHHSSYGSYHQGAEIVLFESG